MTPPAYTQAVSEAVIIVKKTVITIPNQLSLWYNSICSVTMKVRRQ